MTTVGDGGTGVGGGGASPSFGGAEIVPPLMAEPSFHHLPSAPHAIPAQRCSHLTHKSSKSMKSMKSLKSGDVRSPGSPRISPGAGGGARGSPCGHSRSVHSTKRGFTPHVGSTVGSTRAQYKKRSTSARSRRNNSPGRNSPGGASSRRLSPRAEKRISPKDVFLNALAKDMETLPKIENFPRMQFEGTETERELKKIFRARTRKIYQAVELLEEELKHSTALSGMMREVLARRPRKTIRHSYQCFNGGPMRIS